MPRFGAIFHAATVNIIHKCTESLSASLCRRDARVDVCFVFFFPGRPTKHNARHGEAALQRSAHFETLTPHARHTLHPVLRGILTLTSLASPYQHTRKACSFPFFESGKKIYKSKTTLTWFPTARTTFPANNLSQSVPLSDDDDDAHDGDHDEEAAASGG